MMKEPGALERAGQGHPAAVGLTRRRPQITGETSWSTGWKGQSVVRVPRPDSRLVGWGGGRDTTHWAG